MPEFITTASPLAFPYTGAELTDMVNIVPNTYGLLQQMGLFPGQGMATTVVRASYKDGSIVLVPTQPRGGTPTTTGGKREDTKFFEIPHMPALDYITPDDVQNRTSAEDPNRLLTVDEVLMERLEDIRIRHAQTLEWMRMSALKGLIVGGGGETLYNLFQVFGVTKKVINFELDNAATDVVGKCAELRRYYESQLRGEVMTGIRVLVNPTFMDLLITHPNVEKFWINWQAANEMSQGDRRRFVVGGIEFVEYLASSTLGDDARTTVSFIDDGAGHAFPVGTRKAFRTFFGPPYSLSGVNRPPGAEVFISPKVMDHDQGVELKSESDPLPFCHRPDLLVELEAA